MKAALSFSLPQRRRSGFSLVEVAISLGIAAFGLVAIFGLLPIGISTNFATTNQTSVSNIATSIAADLRSTAKPATVSPRHGISLVTGGTYYFDENGGPFPAARSATAGSRYRVVTTVVPPGATQRRATRVGIVLTWPAAADPAKAAGKVTTFVALDRN